VAIDVEHEATYSGQPYLRTPAAPSWKEQLSVHHSDLAQLVPPLTVFASQGQRDLRSPRARADRNPDGVCSRLPGCWQAAEPSP